MPGYPLDTLSNTNPMGLDASNALDKQVTASGWAAPGNLGALGAPAPLPQIQYPGGQYVPDPVGGAASDNFNRANTTPPNGLGTGWTDTSDGGMEIFSNLAIAGNNSFSGDIRTGETYASDQSSQVEVTSQAMPSGGWIGPAVRMQSSGQSLYLGIYFNNGGTYQLLLYKRITGGFTQLGSTVTCGLQSAGAQLLLSVTGSTIVFSLNGVAQITQSDTALTGGNPGILAYNSGQTLAASSVSVDNWVGGGAAGGGVSGSGTGAITFAGSGVATVTVGGAGTGAIAFAGSGTATQFGPVSGTGAITFAGSGVGVVTVSGTGTGAITFGGTGTAKITVTGAGTGAIVFAGTGSASVSGLVSGSGTGAIVFGGSGTGTVTTRGVGTGAITFGGVGTATTFVTTTASGTGAITFAGSGTAVTGLRDLPAATATVVMDGGRRALNVTTTARGAVVVVTDGGRRALSVTTTARGALTVRRRPTAAVIVVRVPGTA